MLYALELDARIGDVAAGTALGHGGALIPPVATP
jgi:hypothetical protein